MIDLSSIKFHYSGPQKPQLVDPEFKIQVTQEVQNIQTRVRTPCTPHTIVLEYPNIKYTISSFAFQSF